MNLKADRYTTVTLTLDDREAGYLAHALLTTTLPGAGVWDAAPEGGAFCRATANAIQDALTGG